MIHYELAEDIGGRIKEIVHKLRMTHLDESRVICVRSKGSNSKRVIVRCHGLYIVPSFPAVGLISL